MEKKQNSVYEKPYRSVVKSLSYRITGTLFTMIASFFISKDMTIALSIGFVDFLSKFLIYYVHERLWGKLKFGLHKRPTNDYEI